MKQLTKSFRKRMAYHLAALIAFYFLLTIGYDLLAGNKLTDSVSYYAVLPTDELEYQVISDGGMVEVEKLWTENQKICYTLRGTEPGNVFLVIKNRGEEVHAVAEYFQVAKKRKNYQCLYG